MEKKQREKKPKWLRAKLPAGPEYNDCSDLNFESHGSPMVMGPIVEETYL